MSIGGPGQGCILWESVQLAGVVPVCGLDPLLPHPTYRLGRASGPEVNKVPFLLGSSTAGSQWAGACAGSSCACPRSALRVPGGRLGQGPIRSFCF